MRLCIFASIALVFAACSGLAGEPQIVATIPPPTVAPTVEYVPHYPAVAPDIEQGAAIYAQHCVLCHGERGAGDGEYVASGQVQNVPDFTNPATAFEDVPANWFQMITYGRLENLMPPFVEALTEAERWSVAMYAYTLHYTPEEIERGHALYQSSCVECHGETGVGDGPRAEEFGQAPGDLTDYSGMVYIDDGAIAVSVREGIGDVMPPHGIEFGGDWTEDDIRAAVGYARTLSLAKASAVGRVAADIPEIAQAATTAPSTTQLSATAESVPDFINITGQLVNGTSSGAVPAGVELTLFAFDAQFNQTQYDTVSTADGTYRYDGIPYTPGSAYIVTVNYRDRVFASDLVREDITTRISAGTVDLPITVYELTDDPGVISISGMVIQVSVIGDGLEIAQVFTVRNNSDRAYTSAELTEDGRPISLVITLPPGSLVASVIGGDQRYVVSQDGSTLFDTAMVLPGDEHVVNLVYLVQYGGGAIMEQEMNYPINGPVRLLVRPTDITVTSSQLFPLGEQVIGSSTYAGYGADMTMDAGDVIRYELGGAGVEANEIDRGLGATPSSNNLPLIVGIVLVIVGLVGGAVYVLSLRNVAAKRAGEGIQSQIDVLAASIAQLDADFAAGKVGEADYQVQRAALKARMASLMGKQ